MLWIQMNKEQRGDWALLPLGLAIILGGATLLNVWAYIADRWAETFASVRVAMNSTPEVRMFEAAKGMHPDAVRALLIHRRTVWRVKYIPLIDVVDWVLDEAPTVHAGFVDYVLDNSNGTIMSKHGKLSEGSKKFDPEGLITDYQQYDDLLKLMQTKLMITPAYGSSGPKIIPPFTVDVIRHRFGLDGAAYDVDDEVSEAMKKVIAEQKKAGWSETSQGVGREASSVPVASRALEGLEQTAEMRARIQVKENLS